MSVETPPFALQNSTVSAELLRRAVSSLLARPGTGNPGGVTGGVIGAGDCVVSPGSGMQVSVAAGEVWVPQQWATTGGGVYCRVASATTLSVPASDPSLPRVDLVVGQVNDAAYHGAVNDFELDYLQGVATSGATLTNKSGAPSVPISAYPLAWVLVPAGSASISAANIQQAMSLATTSIGGLAYALATINTPAVAGQWYVASPGISVTLPTPRANSVVVVSANASVTGSNQATVAAGTTGTINGVGLSSATSFKLGTPGAFAVLEADGSNWWLVAGQQDTGWLPLTLGTNITAFGSITPGVRIVGDQINLRGSLKNNTGGIIANGASYTMATYTLPVSFSAYSHMALSTGGVVAQWTVSTTTLSISTATGLGNADVVLLGDLAGYRF